MPDMEEKKGAEKETSIYEVGYHIVPHVSEDDLNDEVNKMKDIVEKHEGALLSDEERPKHITLAYTITDKVDGKRQDFDTAHFGWFKFEASSGSIPSIKTEIRNLKNVLRFLLIEAEKEPRRSEKRESVLSKPKEKSKKEEKKEEIKEEEVDKAIDELVIE